MDVIHIGSRREVCWDEALIDTARNVRVQMHRPVFRNQVLTCDREWEGVNSAGYFSLVGEPGQYRLYYRAYGIRYTEEGQAPAHSPLWCLAESEDGCTFTRVPVNLQAFGDSTENNILPFPEEALQKGSVFVFRDDNPACPRDERYKALAEFPNQTLFYFKSADGISFEKVRLLADDGAYDSLNVALWDPQTEQYFLYYRGVHGSGTENGKWAPAGANKPHNDNVVRDIRIRTSRDFQNWSEPRILEFDPQREDVDLYINNIQKYYRADHIFLGMPVRYADRYRDSAGIPELPAWPFRERLIRQHARVGTAITDTLLMTSRDGFSFRRTDEAFYTPGPECGTNWFYGDGYFCYGIAETPSALPGEPNEMSLYVGKGYRIHPVTICRYAVRLDGFFSWRCDYTPGRVLTKPFVFQGNTLSINFATSGAGSLRIRLADPEGNILDGYDSGNLFGDSVDRHVTFDKPLDVLSGKPVRVEILMRDADLYAFRFFENSH